MEKSSKFDIIEPALFQTVILKSELRDDGVATAYGMGRACGRHGRRRRGDDDDSVAAEFAKRLAEAHRRPQLKLRRQRAVSRLFDLDQATPVDPHRRTTPRPRPVTVDQDPSRSRPIYLAPKLGHLRLRARPCAKAEDLVPGARRPPTKKTQRRLPQKDPRR